MSRAPDKKLKCCLNFEPQAWRKTLCKNCFKTQSEHPSASESADQTAVPEFSPQSLGDDRRIRPPTPCIFAAEDRDGGRSGGRRRGLSLDYNTDGTADDDDDDLKIEIPRRGSNAMRFPPPRRDPFGSRADVRSSSTDSKVSQDQEVMSPTTDAKPSWRSDKSTSSAERARRNSDSAANSFIRSHSTGDLKFKTADEAKRTPEVVMESWSEATTPTTEPKGHELMKDFKEKLSSIVAMSADRVKGATAQAGKISTGSDQAKVLNPAAGVTTKIEPEKLGCTQSNITTQSDQSKAAHIPEVNTNIRGALPFIGLKQQTSAMQAKDILSEEQIKAIKSKIDAEMSGMTTSVFYLNEIPTQKQSLMNEPTTGPSGTTTQPAARGGTSANVSASTLQSGTAAVSSTGTTVGTVPAAAGSNSCEVRSNIGGGITGENETCLDVGSNTSETAGFSTPRSPAAGGRPTVVDGASSSLLHTQCTDFNLLSSNQISSAASAFPAGAAAASSAFEANNTPPGENSLRSATTSTSNGSQNIVVSNSRPTDGGSNDLPTGSSAVSCETGASAAGQTNQPPTQANSSRLRQRPAERLSGAAAAASVPSSNNNNNNNQTEQAYSAGVVAFENNVAQVNNCEVVIAPIIEAAASVDSINRASTSGARPTLQISNDLTPTSSSALLASTTTGTGLDNWPVRPIDLTSVAVGATGLRPPPGEARESSVISSGSYSDIVTSVVTPSVNGIVQSNLLLSSDKTTSQEAAGGSSKIDSWNSTNYACGQSGNQSSLEVSKVTAQLDSVNASSLVTPSRSKVETTIILSSVGGTGADSASTNRTTSGSQPTNQNAASTYRYVEPNDPRLSYNSLESTVIPIDSLDYTAGGSSQKGSGVLQNSSSAAQRSPAVRRVTSLFHHRPGDGSGADDALDNQQDLQQQQHQQTNQQSQHQSVSNIDWFNNTTLARSHTDEDLSRDRNRISSTGATLSQGIQIATGRRQRRRRLSSYDVSNPCTMDMSMDRSEAMMEGQRMLMESLREKVAILEDRCDRSDRERAALGDLLSAKKTDYDQMKEHYNIQLNDADDEITKLKSEKARLLDKLQLPESERASLAAEESLIAELKRHLEETENRFGDTLAENEDLRGEVRDLHLEMAEIHDQFREEETMEFRELQKELEATAKNCRILQFKLRKCDRRIEQLESDRCQYDEKIRHYESCFSTSDDKRRIRVLEEDLRMSKEVSVRLHEELEKQETRRIKSLEESDRLKNTLNEADNRRLCLQNQVDSLMHEVNSYKMGGAPLPSGEGEGNLVSQLTRDLQASTERENDLKEQLVFAEEEARVTRKKLSEMESENESMSHQIRKLSAAKSGKFAKGKTDDLSDSELLTEKETELKLQLELAEQEVKVFKRKLEEVTQDNDNLLVAVKYLRTKMDQREGGGARCTTPLPEGRTTKDLLARIVAAAGVSGDADQGEMGEVRKELESKKKKLEELETEIVGLRDENCTILKKLESNKVPNQVEKLQELERLKAEVEGLRNQLKTANEDLTKSKKDYESNKKKLKKSNEERETSLAESKAKMDALQKSFDEFKQQATAATTEGKNKPPVAGSAVESGGTVKDKEPPLWKWEKQDFERQINELKRKIEESSLGDAKKIKTKKSDEKVAKNEQDVHTLQTEKEKLEADHRVSTLKTSELEKKIESMMKDHKNEVLDLTSRSDKLTKDHKTVKDELDVLKKKLSKSEETYTKEKTRLELEIKRLGDKLLLPGDKKKTDKIEDELKTLTSANTALTNEKSALTDEVNKLKKELAEKTLQWDAERVKLQTSITSKTATVGKVCTSCERLKNEISSLKSESSSNISKSALSTSGLSAPGSTSSKTSSIPTLPDKTGGTKSALSQKTTDSKNGSVVNGEADRLLLAERAKLEELHAAKTKELQASIKCTMDELTILKAENEKLSNSSTKTLTDLKNSYEKELKSWNTDREQLNKKLKAAEDLKSKITKLEKSVDEVSGKLKAEEAKRRELENKNKILESKAGAVGKSSDKIVTPVEEKLKTTTTGEVKKTNEFLNKFEKFGGGTPRPIRRLSVPAAAAVPPEDTSSAAKSSATTGAGNEKSTDILGEFQKQLSEVEQSRLSDRQELIERLDKQKKEFDLEVELLKNKSSLLDSKSLELAANQKNLVDAHCIFDAERCNWVKERTRLQTQLNEATAGNKSEKEKLIELSAEIKRLKILIGDEKNSVSSLAPVTHTTTDKGGISSSKDTVKPGSTSTIVAPIRKIDEKKTTVDEKKTIIEASSPTSTNKVIQENGKFGKKTFPPTSDTSTVSGVGTAKLSPSGLASVGRTSLPINRINRTFPPPKS